MSTKSTTIQLIAIIDIVVAPISGGGRLVDAFIAVDKLASSSVVPTSSPVPSTYYKSVPTITDPTLATVYTSDVQDIDEDVDNDETTSPTSRKI
jgi:hypothetical protein